MSTEGSKGKSSRKAASERPNPTERTSPSTPSQTTDKYATTPTKPADEQGVSTSETKKPPAKRDLSSESTSPSTPDAPSQPSRQVIAVSASKGPAAFFNLARKFLVTDETCDLSALEGAIVSAVDAAHLLERSKLATIVRSVLFHQ